MQTALFFLRSCSIAYGSRVLKMPNWSQGRFCRYGSLEFRFWTVFSSSLHLSVVVKMMPRYFADYRSWRRKPHKSKKTSPSRRWIGSDQFDLVWLELQNSTTWVFCELGFTLHFTRTICQGKWNSARWWRRRVGGQLSRWWFCRSVIRTVGRSACLSNIFPMTLKRGWCEACRVWVSWLLLPLFKP